MARFRITGVRRFLYSGFEFNDGELRIDDSTPEGKVALAKWRKAWQNMGPPYKSQITEILELGPDGAPKNQNVDQNEFEFGQQTGREGLSPGNQRDGGHSHPDESVGLIPATDRVERGAGTAKVEAPIPGSTANPGEVKSGQAASAPASTLAVAKSMPIIKL